MRLAFAVAAHLEPEILVVDEVLAVGDAAFQNKCLGKMKHVAAEGRTVLFVSHNMGAVNSLCSNCVWLVSGEVRARGQSGPVISQYLRADASICENVTFATGPLRSCKVSVDDRGVRLVAEYKTPIAVDIPTLGFVFHNSLGYPVCGDNPRLSRVERPERSATDGVVTACFRSPRLRDGEYSISLWFGDSGSDMAHYPDALRISVVGHDAGAASDPAVIGNAVPDTVWTINTA